MSNPQRFQEMQPMLVVDKLLGNLAEDSSLEALHRKCLAAGRVETVTLTALDAQKRRFRATTDKGESLGISLERGTFLRDGDVLFLEQDGSRMIVVRLKPEEVLRITLLPSASEEEIIEVAVRVGHILGNQHWPITIKGRDIFVPVTIDKEVVETVLRTYDLQGITYAFEEHAVGAMPPLQPKHHDHHHGHPHSHPHNHDREG